MIFESDLTFRVWTYGIGHSQLLLRSASDESEDDGVDLLFEGVAAMRLTMRYEALKLHSVDEEEFRDVFAGSGVDDRWRGSFVIVRLASRSGGGYVQCARITAERRRGESPSGPDPVGSRDILWSLRP
ncbi:hypothetical protein ACIQRW_07380 [Streptomyces sp. NPDC091287]|uniref:hypothetical protein n=1 Tax=Streptomyces sp. NPDC091287 TaxID=3365988 RepID=UPI0038018237